MRGYSTKYALSTGIQVVETNPLLTVSNSAYRYTKGPYRIQLKLGTDLFETRQEAVDKAKEMAKKKILSLEKSIKKMKVLAQHPKWDPESSDE